KIRYNYKAGFLYNSSAYTQTTCSRNPGQGTVSQVTLINSQNGNHLYYPYDTQQYRTNGALVQTNTKTPEREYLFESDRYGLSKLTDKLGRVNTYEYLSSGHILSKSTGPDGVVNKLDHEGTNLKF